MPDYVRAKAGRDSHRSHFNIPGIPPTQTATRAGGGTEESPLRRAYHGWLLAPPGDEKELAFPPRVR
jgi:hypothetical protein